MHALAPTSDLHSMYIKLQFTCWRPHCRKNFCLLWKMLNFGSNLTSTVHFFEASTKAICVPQQSTEMEKRWKFGTCTTSLATISHTHSKYCLVLYPWGSCTVHYHYHSHQKYQTSSLYSKSGFDDWISWRRTAFILFFAHCSKQLPICCKSNVVCSCIHPHNSIHTNIVS